MRKIKVVLTIFVMLLTNINYVSAAELIDMETLEIQNNSETKDILTLETEAFKWLDEAVFHETNKHLDKDYKVDLSTAVKVYYGAPDLFGLGGEDLTGYLNTLEHYWIFQDEYNGMLLELTIDIGSEVTDEFVNSIDADTETGSNMLEEARKNEGKWCVTSAGVQTKENTDNIDLPMDEKIENALSDIHYSNDTNAYLCSGIPNITGLIALVGTEQKAEVIVPINDMYVEGTDEEIKEVLADGAEAEDQVYDFDAIGDAIERMPDDENNEVVFGEGNGILLASAIPSQETQGDAGISYEYFIAAVVLVIAGGGVFLYKKKRKKAV